MESVFPTTSRDLFKAWKAARFRTCSSTRTAPYGLRLSAGASPITSGESFALIAREMAFLLTTSRHCIETRGAYCGLEHVRERLRVSCRTASRKCPSRFRPAPLQGLSKTSTNQCGFPHLETECSACEVEVSQHTPLKMGFRTSGSPAY